MRNVFALAVLPTLVLTAAIASAQSTTPWDGFYLGASLGGENTKFCSSSVLTGMNSDPATSTFTRCSSGGLVGGLQFGENFQIKRLVLGIGADLVVSEAKSESATSQLMGAAPPPGTYSLSGKLSPKDFAIIGGRIGYGGNVFFPYVRAGAVVTTGSQSSTLAYVPPGTTTPVASSTIGLIIGISPESCGSRDMSGQYFRLLATFCNIAHISAGVLALAMRLGGCNAICDQRFTNKAGET
jgi:opacity protein-like surface antigen